MGVSRLTGLSAATGVTVARNAPAASAGAGASTIGRGWAATELAGTAGSPEGPLGVPVATGEALTVDVMPPWSVPGCVSATGVVGPEEFVVESPAPEGGAPLDVVPAELLVGEVEAWPVVGCGVTLGGGVPDADAPSDAALGGGVVALAGGVGAGEVVVGGGVVVASVGGAGVAVGGAGAGDDSVGGPAAGGQSADVPVAGSSVGRHVTCAAAGSVTVAAGSATVAAGSGVAAAGSAIDAVGATIIVASCSRPAPATAHIHRRAARPDMHVLRLIFVWAPKLTANYVLCRSDGFTRGRGQPPDSQGKTDHSVNAR